MTEAQTKVLPTETIQVKENGDIQSSGSSSIAPGPVEKKKGEEQSKNVIGTHIQSQSFLVFDANAPRCIEDVEIVPQNEEIGSEIHLDYYPDNILSQFDEDLVNLVELDQATGSDDKSLAPSTNLNADEKIKFDTIGVNNILPQESIDVKADESGQRGFKRKSECLEDGSLNNSSENIYTVDPRVLAKRAREPKRNVRDKMVSRLIDYQVQCVNFNCKSGYGLEAAPVFVLTYFGQNRKKNVLQKVCRECFKMAFHHQQDLIYLLKTRKSILKANFPPQTNEIVVMDVVEEKYEEELLPDKVVSQVRKYLPDMLAKSAQKYDMDYQIEQACEILNEKLQVIEENNRAIDSELDAYEMTLREARLIIYKDFTPKIKQLPPLTIMDPFVKPEVGLLLNTEKLYTRVHKPIDHKFSQHDIVTVQEIEIPQKKLPPGGSLIYPLLSAGSQVYIMKISLLGLWVKGRIIEVIGQKPEQSPSYRVRFESSHSGGLAKLVSGKFLAYNKPSPVRYPVGTRVIALYRNKDAPSKSAYYVGIVAEPPKHLNKFRYLIFFDDGYAQYVEHEKVLLVCECSKLVHEDVYTGNREFIKKYLERYPERPMVKLLKGQIVRVEWNGKWWVARVVEVDCSLAKIHFDADGRTEWVYRGSTRLGPLYSELVVGTARKDGSSVPRHRTEGIASLKKKNMPYVEYNVDLDDPNTQKTVAGNTKNVAKKSTNTKACASENPGDRYIRSPDLTHLMEYITKGYIRSMDVSQRIIGKTFVPHQCGPPCTKWTNYSESKCRGMSPLSIPLFYGFERQTIKHKTKRTVMYCAPCGRRLRTMIELHRYLRITKTAMGLDLFDFDYTIHVLDEFHLEKDMYRTHLKDISYGLEKNPVSCVNEIDHSWPAFMDYSTSRIPQEGVNICYDDEFLVCCDCDDDCQDKSKCDCWQLTIEGTKVVHNGVVDSSVGYKYKRLLEPVATGIYECNHKCKCASTCLNRVAQHPLQLNLQVFRTLKKGWGLRTVNDIPQGGFICIYAGRLHTEQSANDDGRMYGDEYLAELDYIEVVERFKEGYESEVVEPTEKNEQEEIERNSKNKNDEDYVPEGMHRVPQTQNGVNTRARNKKISTKESSKSGGEKVKKEGGCGEHLGKMKRKGDENKENPSKHNSSTRTREERHKKFKSVREMYGDSADDCYIMDAKSIGNIGRYLNHSCQPNVFVQNVFVDSHDVRFPWVAFFALAPIRAGTELTWDYNYDVGSVPDKVLYCYCNKAECRGRLL